MALAAPGAGEAPVLLTRGLFPGAVHYNSTRDPESDKLDSSPMQFDFHVPADVEASSVTLEIVYFDGGVPMVFVEDAVGTPGSFVMSPMAAPRIVQAHKDGRLLVLQVERKFPLSSSHGGRKFRLAFCIGQSVVFTEAFTVLAKKAKKGVGVKLVHKPKLLTLPADRANRLATIGPLARQHLQAEIAGTLPPPPDVSVPELLAQCPTPCPAGATGGAVAAPVSPSTRADFFDDLFNEPSAPVAPSRVHGTRGQARKRSKASVHASRATPQSVAALQVLDKAPPGLDFEAPPMPLRWRLAAPAMGSPSAVPVAVPTGPEGLPSETEAAALPKPAPGPAPAAEADVPPAAKRARVCHGGAPVSPQLALVDPGPAHDDPPLTDLEAQFLSTSEGV